MKHFVRIVAVTALIIIGAIDTVAIEEAKYEVIKKDNEFEIRDYSTYIIAETIVDGTLEDAGNKGFDQLFRYISGDNRSRDTVAMTAPVSQQPMGEKIAMTAPVGQRRIKGKWVVSFMMPSSQTLKTLPEPEDPKITLRQVPARRMAAVRYSGFWSEEGYRRNMVKLESWIDRMGLATVGDPIWARYNPPYVPWFLRRNEVLIPVDVGTGQEEAQQSHGDVTQ